MSQLNLTLPGTAREPTEADAPAPTKVEEAPKAEDTPSDLPLHLQFTSVRTELLAMERAKAEGKEINIDRVQELVRTAADLMAKIQTSTTGPKKKIIDKDGEAGRETKPKKPKAEKKPSSIAHLAIPEGDDF